MRILLIKMSSMGDVFHTFPALSDAQEKIPGLQVDWVVEKSFADIPKWHPVVDNVFPIELRKWRRNLLKRRTFAEIQDFFAKVNNVQYDLVLDAQGLYKSLWVARHVDAPIYGMDFNSARERLVSLFYHRKFYVNKNAHAIKRLRNLFSQALDYSIDLDSELVYGLNTLSWNRLALLPWQAENYFVFLHGTTWETKCWPEVYWTELLQKICQAGYKVVLPWGNQEEKARAHYLQSGYENDVWVPERMLSLNEMAQTLKFASGVVSVDTGLSHVVAALEVPMVVLYRVTDPQLIGAYSSCVKHLISPLASHYIKRFKDDAQNRSSLENIGVREVVEALNSLNIKLKGEL